MGNHRVLKNLDFDLFVFDNYRICPNTETWVGLAFAGFGIIGITVDRTHSDTVSDSASAEGAHGMRAGVVHSIEFATFVENGDPSAIDGERFAASFSDR